MFLDHDDILNPFCTQPMRDMKHLPMMRRLPRLPTSPLVLVVCWFIVDWKPILTYATFGCKTSAGCLLLQPEAMHLKPSGCKTCAHGRSAAVKHYAVTERQWLTSWTALAGLDGRSCKLPSASPCTIYIASDPKRPQLVNNQTSDSHNWAGTSTRAMLAQGLPEQRLSQYGNIMSCECKDYTAKPSQALQLEVIGLAST